MFLIMFSCIIKKSISIFWLNKNNNKKTKKNKAYQEFLADEYA